MVESGPGGIRDCETAGRDAKSSGVTNGDTSDFIVSNEEWLIGKESNAPWIGQAWRQIVGDARKVRGQIGLIVCASSFAPVNATATSKKQDMQRTILSVTVPPSYRLIQTSWNSPEKRQAEIKLRAGYRCSLTPLDRCVPRNCAVHT
jgi:hypothetical protein